MKSIFGQFSFSCQLFFLKGVKNQEIIYSGNRLRSTPRDRENVLTLSEVDFIVRGPEGRKLTPPGEFSPPSFSHRGIF